MRPTLERSRALVAGGTGFIGANLVLRLLAEGCRVRSTVHQREPVVRDPAVEYLPADLTRMEDCRRAVAGVEYVFMCAANTSGAAVATTTPLVYVTPNVVMNAQLLDAAYSAGVKKFLFISSSAVYPPTDGRPVREEEVLDGEPYEVYYPVAWMKRYTEILCHIYARKIKSPMPTVVIRPSNMYGPYDDFDPRTSHMTAALIRRVVERHNPLEVWGTGDEVRDLIYVDDFVEGMLLGFQQDADYLVVNIASGQGYSVKEVLRTALQVDGYADATVRFDPTKPTTIPIRLFDTSLAQRLLGFKASTSLREGLARTIRWYREAAANLENRARGGSSSPAAPRPMQ